MYLKQLELVGFKSFAKKTTLDFPEGIVAIVGPNGVGKSNIVDAVRWVLAEQSLKTLRGRKGEDLIFHGSPARTGGAGRSALSRARVSLTLDNVGKTAGLDVDEMVLARTVSKKGDNSYFLNGTKVRLMDLETFLSSSGIGTGSFRVLSQGMSDMLITLGPEEFRAFIEDAAGVTEFQDKRHRSLLKIRSTGENLEKVSVLLAELAPRVRFLKREASKLGRRDKVEKELIDTTQALFSFRYSRLSKYETTVARNKKGFEEKIIAANKKIEKAKKDLFSIGTTALGNKAITLERKIQKIQSESFALRKSIFDLESRITRERTGASVAVPVKSLEKELSSLIKKGEELLANPSSLPDSFGDFVNRLRLLFEKVRGDENGDGEKVKELEDKIKRVMTESEKTEAWLKELLAERERLQKESSVEKDELWKKEREFQDAHEGLRALERKQNHLDLEEEKTKLRIEQILNDLRSLGVLTLAEVLAKPPPAKVDEEKLEEKLWRLKRRAEQIGSIEPAVEEEYEGVRERFEFLEREKKDLSQTLEKLENIVSDLDREIQKRFKNTLSDMSDRFADYIHLMFDGGRGELNHTPASDDNEGGIEIGLSLPGKKIKDLTMLSGGERTLVSIALLFSLVTIRRPPFLVLDEIDAALDETNSERFVRLLETLAKDTQFIVITHNRTTMRGAKALYGVSMKDGVSGLLSLKLEEVAPLTG